ncbi:hypothetical protein MTP99_014852 [Tenebrio molitor]|nr:hypothetical protein MTP99_014852 [Tenebrio molitor]
MQGAGCEDIDRGVVQCPSSPANVPESVWGKGREGLIPVTTGHFHVSGHLTWNCSGSSTIPHVSRLQLSLITATGPTRNGATLDVSEIGKHSNNTLNSHITHPRSFCHRSTENQ